LVNAFHNKKILVAPLDWGLGHATRCIPLIRYLIQTGCKVVLASSGTQAVLLKTEFPALQIIPLQGYNIWYSANKRWLPFVILWQTPKTLLNISREHRWLRQLIKNMQIDFVISDNRYGLWNKQTPCAFITHQLNIKAPYPWLQNLIQKINYRYINRFTVCWVPDFEGNFNIAGSLSHTDKIPAIPVDYIGPLSRLNAVDKVEKKYSFLVIISGPEPQRTLFENKILKVVPQLNGSTLIVRGKPGSEEKITAPANCTIVNHLPASQLQQAFAESEFIISRSGYTTVMEVLSLQKKSILIPTPGQTEQEYLALHLMHQGWCYTCSQNDDLLFHINKAIGFTFNLPLLPPSSFSKVVDDFLGCYK